MEPLLPSGPQLEDLAMDVAQEAAALGAAVPQGTQRGLVDLLRTVNCYYSNKIEGHDTRPADIERAMNDDYAEDPTVRMLQRESRAHIDVQKLTEGWLDADPTLNVGSAEFLCRVHKEFYDRVPNEFRFVEDPVTKLRLPIVPGEIREHRVTVGRHAPPPPGALPGFLARFREVYEPSRLSRIERVIAMAASHHRLMWIHPFLDGNGRVTRLFSVAYGIRAGVGGEGLWSVSRGLARRRGTYMDALAGADEDRRNDYDGRGMLSHAALVEFCIFFLETCRDQITYMRDLLQLETFGDRLLGYAKLRATGNAARPALRSPGSGRGRGTAEGGGRAAGSFREEAGLLLREVMLRGEVPRGEASRITGLGERTARSMLAELSGERLLLSDGPKLPVRLGYPAHAVGYYFPLLYPEGVTWEQRD